MGRSQETFNKKEVRSKQEKKRKEKEKKRLAKKEEDKKSSLDDMIAYVDENGNITDTPPDPSKKTEVDLEGIEYGIPKREKEDDNPNRKGTVTFYNDAKGFGFIKDQQTKESIFFHINNFLDDSTIKEGNLVSYIIEQGPKGPTAIQVALEK
jgi:cold shock CspA family protein